MFRSLIVLSLALVGCYALTDEEIALFYNDGCAGGYVSVTRSGDEITLSTNGIPDHKWQLCNEDPVLGNDVEVTFPSEPTFAEAPYCLAGGPIGWTINGVAIFNPFALGEVNAVDGADQQTFDFCDGHPTPNNRYHYHKLPDSCVYLHGTQTEQFIGVAKDGFAIYGPYQADLGRDATNDDLDECHGRLVNDSYCYIFLGKGEENYPYGMGCYRAEPARGAGGGTPLSCAQCTNGDTPCYAAGQVCTCIGEDDDVEVDLLRYDETTEEGNGNLTQCHDDPISATCRDPHDQTPDDLDSEVLNTV